VGELGTTHRRLVGLALAILLVGLGRAAMHFASELEAGYPVTAILGDAGTGLNAGSDVKIRGVLVGEVVGVAFEDGHAVAELEIDHEVQVPRDVEVVVTAKTLLGPKQVELRPEGHLVAPYLEPGDVIRADPEHGPTEIQEVIHELEAVFGDVPTDELATLVEAMGSFDRTDAEVIARNIDQSEVLADFGARTADAQLERIAALADITTALAPRADDMNRLARSLPDWVSVLPDRQADVRDSLDALSSFAVGFAELLEAEESEIRRLMVLGDRIGGVIEPRVHEVGTLIEGIYRYTRMFGQHGGSLTDGTEHSWFRAHYGDEGEWARFCEELPEELLDAAPGCVERGHG
jgi:phospholipid/cholesterol/gamma-HCH transport system substrate-binding protein